MTFADLQLAEPLLRVIQDVGYASPTPIQKQAIPLVLAGGDVLAAAQTGTGKTASFTLPILQRLNNATTQSIIKQPRCLILTPTRELAAQVGESVITYGKNLSLTSLVIFGGVRVNPQVQALAQQAIDILVATPGRLLDLVKQEALDLSKIEILVLDEADRMLDMGFIRDIRRVLKLVPTERQTLLFSATFSDEIRALVDQFLRNPNSVEVSPANSTADSIEQVVHEVAKLHKSHLLIHLIKSQKWRQTLVFTRTKHGANRLAEKLSKADIPAMAIHGNKSQAARTRALAEFKEGNLPVLVATDIAARGLDIDMLPHVVNYELPNVPEDYVHRIGRTGRAGCEGCAVSLVEPEELGLLEKIEKFTEQQISRIVAIDFVAPELPSVQVETKLVVNVAPEQGKPPQRRNNRRNKPRLAPQEAAPVQAKPQQQQARPQSQQQQVNQKKPKKQFLSEAARHQAMPQPPLFAPSQKQRDKQGGRNSKLENHYEPLLHHSFKSKRNGS